MGIEIGSVRTADSMVAAQRTATQPADAVSKNIQSDISDVERQRQGLTSKEGMSSEEKAKKRRELQQELSSLNTKLRQRQSEIRKEQQREIRTEELRAEAAGTKDAKKGKAVESSGSAANKTGSRAQNTDGRAAVSGNAKKDAAGAQSAAKTASGAEKAKENKTGSRGKERDTLGVGETKKGASGVSDREQKAAGAKPADQKDKGAGLEDVAMPAAKMRKLIAADSAREQNKRQEAVIARLENDIVILKGEIKQDEARGADTEQKKAQLKRQEEKVQQAATNLPPEDSSSKPVGEKVQIRVDGARQKPETDVTKDSGDGIVIAATNLSRELFQ